MTGPPNVLTDSLTDSQIARLVIQVQGIIGVTTEQLAGRIGRPADLIGAWERADARPTDADLNALAAQCGVTAKALVARVQAFSIDRAMGILHVGGSSAYVDPAQGNAHVLETYVGLVRNMRMLSDGGPVELRSHDLDVLADYLDLDDVDLVKQLAKAASVSESQAIELRHQLMRRPILASVAGLLAGGLATLGIAGRAAADRPAAVPTGVIAQAAPSTSSTMAITSTWSRPSVDAVSTAAPTIAPATTEAATTTTTEASTTTAATEPPRHAAGQKATSKATVPAPEIADALTITNPNAGVPFPTPRP